jgi:hypothetical protein
MLEMLAAIDAVGGRHKPTDHPAVRRPRQKALASLPVLSAKSCSSQIPRVAVDCLPINRLSYRRRPPPLKRVHQPTECLDKFADAFVLELLGGRIQINPHFA